MKIDSIELWHCKLPYKQPWRTSFGVEPASHTIITHVRAGGYEGWGESCPGHRPTYCPEAAASCFTVASQYLAPHLLGVELKLPCDVSKRLAVFRGNPFAKASLDTAVWDMFAQMEGKPLYELLGGTRVHVQAGADFGIEESIDDLLGKIQTAVDIGHPRVKLKIDPTHDVEVVSAVRAAFPDLIFHVDCNACYTLDDLDTLKKLDKYNLAMIEQPLHHTDLLDHAALQGQLQTPICLDESITCPRDFEQALRIDACRAVNVKPGRVGGLTSAIEIERLAREEGLTAWVGGMLESAIGVRLLIALASLEGFGYPGDLFPSQRFYIEDMTEAEVTMDDDCTFAVAKGPSPTPIRSRLEAAAINYVRLTQ